ncbi:hypothetical protein PGT21_010215 [Puccinia graminis f. sp. tritici]|uniref:Uncharacterized protein n=1 Tax=Puccinia graminis f. sp. tritici TaxID=56615 RepID=A0A5B0P8Z1_PUCGR|nr:hypothetical protein PGT21_010215 [Puccinia graminis f. sp. tritici]KAA1134104.1 hypothetical protein PGTUg99_026640 [Puccinia graminis f. sp. tritici]
MVFPIRPSASEKRHETSAQPRPGRTEQIFQDLVPVDSPNTSISPLATKPPPRRALQTHSPTPRSVLTLRVPTQALSRWSSSLQLPIKPRSLTQPAPPVLGLLQPHRPLDIAVNVRHLKQVSPPSIAHLLPHLHAHSQPTLLCFIQTDDEPSRRQRARTEHRASELLNPFLDVDRPDSDEDLPQPETLDGTRPPGETLTIALGAQVLPSSQLAMLAEIPQPEHTTVILSTLAAVLKRLNALTQQESPRTPLDAPPAANLSLAEQIRMFQFSPEAKEFLRQQARESMMQPDLEAYSEDTRDRGLFRMVLAGILRQPAPYLRAQFPPGFVAQDRLAMNHTHTESKRQLKNVRHQLRNLLLTGVLASNAEVPPIPNLTKLARDVWRFLMGTATRLSNEEVDHRVIPLLKIRIAYLRLATMENHFDPMARNISQWDQINSQLQANRERTVNFTNSWHRMIYLKDEQLFSTSPALADVDTSLCKCPTDREVLDRMASLDEA